MPSRIFPGLGLRGGYSIGEDGWGTNLTEDLRKISIVSHLTVASRVSSLPDSPTEGDRHILTAEDSNSEGSTGSVIAYENNDWVFYTPSEGWVAWVLDESEEYRYTGGVWVVSSASSFGAPDISYNASGEGDSNSTETTVQGALDDLYYLVRQGGGGGGGSISISDGNDSNSGELAGVSIIKFEGAGVSVSEPDSNGEVVVTVGDAGATIRTVGWADYVDTTYTGSNPFSIVADTITRLPNNAGTIRDQYKPDTIASFYTIDDDSNSSGEYGRLTGREGDARMITLEMTVEPTAPSTTYIEVWINIGGSVGVLYERINTFPKGQDVERPITFTTGVYTLDTWEANGGEVYVRANGAADISDIRFVVYQVIPREGTFLGGGSGSLTIVDGNDSNSESNADVTSLTFEGSGVSVGQVDSNGNLVVTITGGGGGGSNTNSLLTAMAGHQDGALVSTGTSAACKAYAFTPSNEITTYRAGFLINSVSGATYRAFIAAVDGSNTITSITYADANVVASATSTGVGVWFDWATGVTMNASTKYYIGLVRSDDTDNYALPTHMWDFDNDKKNVLNIPGLTTVSGYIADAAPAVSDQFTDFSSSNLYLSLVYEDSDLTGSDVPSLLASSHKYVRVEQNSGQTVNNTTATVEFQNIVEDADGMFDGGTEYLTIPAALDGVAVMLDAEMQHTGDASGNIEFYIERSTDGGSAWDRVGQSSNGAIDHFGIVCAHVLMKVNSGDIFRVRLYSSGNKTTSGNARTSLTLQSFGQVQAPNIPATTISTETADYQLTTSDANTILEISSSSTEVVTIPANATEAISIGSIINVVRLGTGGVTVTAAAGVTLNGISEGSAGVSAQFESVSLYKRAANEWIITGSHGGVS